MSISLAPFHPTAPRPSQSWYHLECRRDPRLYQRYEGGSLVGPVSTPCKECYGGALRGPQGMGRRLGGCPQLIVFLLFKDKDDDHGDDDGRRNLSTSGSLHLQPQAT